MKTVLTVILFLIAFISDLLFSVEKFPVALLILSGIVLIYIYASPYLLKR